MKIAPDALCAAMGNRLGYDGDACSAPAACAESYSMRDVPPPPGAGNGERQ
ncbi:MAG: hypothetical protein LBH95_03845 [Oscillospiraceae bacterium]|jgi:hypothetical protein|nr:hypothetical protein [Oscillospiraceae bacterium]